MAKKFRRMFAYLLTASIMLSLFSVNGFAGNRRKEAPITLDVGETISLTSGTGTDLEEETVDAPEEESWTSSNEGVAAVSADGSVEALSSGEATISHSTYRYRSTYVEDGQAVHDYYDLDEVSDLSGLDCIRETEVWTIQVLRPVVNTLDDVVVLDEYSVFGGNITEKNEGVFYSTGSWNPPYAYTVTGSNPDQTAVITIEGYNGTDTYAAITASADVSVSGIAVKASKYYRLYTVPNGVLEAGVTYVVESVSKGESGAGGDQDTLHEISHVALLGGGALIPSQPELISVAVEKVWKNADGTVMTQPTEASVQVQLYKDGAAEGSAVTLSSANSWSHTWNGLDKDAAWTVDEVAVPDGYSKSVTHTDNQWTITNTKQGGYDGGSDGDTDTTPQPPVEIPEDPTPTTSAPDPQDPVILPEENVPLEELPEEPVPMAEVPQTGDSFFLWVGALVASGMAILLLADKKKADSHS
ncbi:Cna B-type domain-containing protein [Flavonifractor sp. An100]|uniref:Cna B-type domain-containing protein n=1 Tax=Flavonifractor sp. An100 TaxID=1965538 RepID=UPI00130267B2|nr:Cna B-type domain-containing protein [Flavonifractor sp. An100]